MKLGHFWAKPIIVKLERIVVAGFGVVFAGARQGSRPAREAEELNKPAGVDLNIDQITFRLPISRSMKFTNMYMLMDMMV